MGDTSKYIEDQWRRLEEHHANAQPDAAATLPLPSILEAFNLSVLGSQNPVTRLQGQPEDEVVEHINRDIVPALCGQAKSSRYYGFVTGGTLPIAEWADNVVSHMDQNVQVHLPHQSASTAVEDAALTMLLSVLRMEEGHWKGRTFTTGATSSNVLGLACGREAVLAKRLGADKGSVGELGLLGASALAGITQIQVLTSAGHSSLSKAASVVGLGRAAVKELARSEREPWKLDIDAVERELKRAGTASIIAVSGGEVNTGRYALDDAQEWTRLRKLADEYHAWIHVDGAFGIFGRVLEDGDEYATIRRRVEGITMADSITVDGHKVLNVPYDCGMFFTRDPLVLQSVFRNPNAAYLSAGGGTVAEIPSPLNIGLENSRRFRALPAYAVLLSKGRRGIAAMVSNMVQLSRKLATYLRDSPHYQLLPDTDATGVQDVFIIVLFTAKDKELNEVLVDKINASRQMYVSGTSWRGEKATRIAVSNWRVDVEKDYEVVTDILSAVAKDREIVPSS